MNWPPRSCNLALLDYFLWDYVKGQVYKNNPQTISELKAEIIRVVSEIEPQLCANVINNFDKRIANYKDARGSHLPYNIFNV